MHGYLMQLMAALSQGYSWCRLVSCMMTMHEFHTDNFFLSLYLCLFYAKSCPTLYILECCVYKVQYYATPLQFFLFYYNKPIIYAECLLRLFTTQHNIDTFLELSFSQQSSTQVYSNAVMHVIQRIPPSLFLRGLFLFHNYFLPVFLSFWLYLEADLLVPSVQELFLSFFGHSFAYVDHFIFLRYVWILTQRAALASREMSG